MRSAKIISSLLCISLSLSLTGCFGGSRLSPARLMSYAEDNEAKVYDSARKYSSFLDEIRSGSESVEIGDGAVIRLEGKDIKTVFGKKSICMFPIVDDFYDKGMTEAVVYCTGKVKSKSDAHIEYIYSIGFEDEDSAEEYFDDMHDGIQPKSSNNKAKNDNGEEDGISYSVMTIYDNTFSAGVGVYRDGKTVMLIVAYGYNNTKGHDVVDGICEDFGLHLISDV